MASRGSRPQDRDAPVGRHNGCTALVCRFWRTPAVLRQHIGTPARAARRGRPDQPATARLTRADRVVELVAARDAASMTVRELCRSLRVHHGIASGALSRLDRQRRLQRTGTYRDGCAMYVTP